MIPDWHEVFRLKSAVDGIKSRNENSGSHHQHSGGKAGPEGLTEAGEDCVFHPIPCSMTEPSTALRTRIGRMRSPRISVPLAE